MIDGSKNSLLTRDLERTEKAMTKKNNGNESPMDSFMYVVVIRLLIMAMNTILESLTIQIWFLSSID